MNVTSTANKGREDRNPADYGKETPSQTKKSLLKEEPSKKPKSARRLQTPVGRGL